MRIVQATQGSRFGASRASAMPLMRFVPARARPLPGGAAVITAVADAIRHALFAASRPLDFIVVLETLAHAPVATAARHLRPEAPARRPGRGDRSRDGRRADAGGDADRRGQVALLPASRPPPARHDARRLAADRVDEGPVRQAARARRRRRPAEQRGRRRRDRRGGEGDRRRRGEDRVHDARAARRCRVPRSRRDASGQPRRRRRSALHLAVGPRLPAGLPRDRQRAAAPRQADDPRPHGDRHRGGDRRHRPPARRAPIRDRQHRPLSAEPALPGPPGHQRGRQAAARR